MKKADITTKNIAELQSEVTALRTKLREVAFKAAGAQAVRPHERRAMRRTIARLLTALRAKEAGVVDNL